MLLNEPKHEKLLAEMDMLNHNLGDLILMGKGDETHYKEMIKVLTAFAQSCQVLLKDECGSLKMKQTQVIGGKIRRSTIMSESLTKLLKEITQGSDEMGTYHRKYNDGPKGPQFAGLVAQTTSGTEYSTTDPAVSEQFFQNVDYTGEAVTGLGSPENGEHGYESCGHWHTFALQQK